MDNYNNERIHKMPKLRTQHNVSFTEEEQDIVSRARDKYKKKTGKKISYAKLALKQAQDILDYIEEGEDV